jgi:hypothetical protein
MFSCRLSIHVRQPAHASVAASACSRHSNFLRVVSKNVYPGQIHPRLGLESFLRKPTADVPDLRFRLRQQPTPLFIVNVTESMALHLPFSYCLHLSPPLVQANQREHLWNNKSIRQSRQRHVFRDGIVGISTYFHCLPS